MELLYVRFKLLYGYIVYAHIVFRFIGLLNGKEINET